MSLGANKIRDSEEVRDYWKFVPIAESGRIEQTIVAVVLSFPAGICHAIVLLVGP